MIANPKLKAFKYDPYAKKLTEELYDHERMLKTRHEAIQRAAETGKYGLVLSTLGRQGRPNVLKTLQNRIEALGKETVVILLSEIFPDKIKLFKGIDAFIQVQSLLFIKEHFTDCSKNSRKKNLRLISYNFGFLISHCCGSLVQSRIPQQVGPGSLICNSVFSPLLLYTEGFIFI